MVEVVNKAEGQIRTYTIDGQPQQNTDSRLTSDRVLGILAGGLKSIGYEVERGKKQDEKIQRPVLYGDNGDIEVKYEIDAWHPIAKVILEVEAGRGAANNAD